MEASGQLDAPSTLFRTKSHRYPACGQEKYLFHILSREFLFLYYPARLRSQKHKLRFSEFYDPVFTGFQMFSSTPQSQAHPHYFISLISQPCTTDK